MGSGVKHKIPIAMAMRKAIVTTTSGCHGIDLRDGEHALVADDPAGFAEAVDRVLSDPDLRRRLGRRARELAVERYDWDRIVAGLEAELENKLIETRRSKLET
jgi:glycosyltransferase involved in cell wall biosynthesis